MLTVNEIQILGSLMTKDMYGLEIIQFLKERVNKSILLGSLYNVLRRLEKKGFVKSYFDDQVENRGGNRRRYYSISAEGTAAFTDSVNSLQPIFSLA